MVIYFTGTGNSRYVAEAIADRLDDDAVCANDYIKKNETGVFESDKPWVFVTPVYLSTIAEIFADFIRSSSFGGSKKAYCVATCASAMGSVPNVFSDICEKKGLEYMGAAKVLMPQNYIALFTMTEPQECEKRQNDALVSADEISSAVRGGTALDCKKASGIEYSATKLVEKMYNGHFTKAKKFRVTDACTGCGLCVRSCPVNNITASENGRPSWIKACVHCMACINRCPAHAIEYGKKTEPKTRYVCPKYVSKQ